MASQKPNRKIGYARVSTDGQDTALQIDALTAAGCVAIHQDQVSGSVKKRHGLDAALVDLQPGDVLIVWRLDRLGRSLPHLLEVVTGLAERCVGFQSLSDSIDTTTASGRFVFHLMASLAEFERSLIGERTKAGMAAAKARGSAIGRRHALTPSQLTHAIFLIEKGESPSMVARSMKVGRSTLYRAISLKKAACADASTSAQA